MAAVSLFYWGYGGFLGLYPLVTDQVFKKTSKGVECQYYGLPPSYMIAVQIVNTKTTAQSRRL